MKFGALVVCSAALVMGSSPHKHHGGRHEGHGPHSGLLANITSVCPEAEDCGFNATQIVRPTRENFECLLESNSTVPVSEECNDLLLAIQRKMNKPKGPKHGGSNGHHKHHGGRHEGHGPHSGLFANITSVCPEAEDCGFNATQIVRPTRENFECLLEINSTVPVSEECNDLLLAIQRKMEKPKGPKHGGSHGHKGPKGSKGPKGPKGPKNGARPYDGERPGRPRDDINKNGEDSGHRKERHPNHGHNHPNHGHNQRKPPKNNGKEPKKGGRWSKAKINNKVFQAKIVDACPVQAEHCSITITEESNHEEAKDSFLCLLAVDKETIDDECAQLLSWMEKKMLKMQAERDGGKFTKGSKGKAHKGFHDRTFDACAAEAKQCGFPVARSDKPKREEIKTAFNCLLNATKSEECTKALSWMQDKKRGQKPAEQSDEQSDEQPDEQSALEETSWVQALVQGIETEYAAEETDLQLASESEASHAAWTGLWVFLLLSQMFLFA